MIEPTFYPLLAFDTATPTARVAMISPAGDCLALREKTAARHSANLLGLCEEVLCEVGVKVAGLKAIACGAGPGSFTGLRVGLAVAKGLALPWGIPLILLSSLDALACDLAKISPDVKLILPCIDAGKGQVYARLYIATDGAVPAAQGDVDWVLSPDDLCRLIMETALDKPLLAGGTGVDRYIDIFRTALGASHVRQSVAGPSSASIGRLALAHIEQGHFDDIETAVPRYGRPPDITLPKKALLLP
jgi:tRNA threonylcarbamoyladenosine biosynthesis protein TsaB